MKRILILLSLIGCFAVAQTTRTSIFQLPQWNTYDTLRAGSVNLAATSNSGLNNGFSRLDSILGQQIDSTGKFRSINGRGTGNLTIDAGTGTATAQRVVFNDSIYTTYNIQTTANILTGGNVNVGGFLSTDSVLSPFLNVDSVAALNIYHIVYQMSFTDASTSVNDTSAYAAVVWKQDTTRNADLTYKRKARFIYLHNPGTKYLRAYFSAYEDVADDGGVCQMIIRNTSLAIVGTQTSETIADASYANQIFAYDVSGLSDGTRYIIDFTMRDNSTAPKGTLYVKDLIVIAVAK